MKRFIIIFSITILVLPIGRIHATVLNISVFPDRVIQGEPVKVMVENLSATSTVKQIIFDGQSIPIFFYEGKPTALIGIDLNKKSGEYKLSIKLSDGTTLEKIISVGMREKIEAPLGIPEKLGGNTQVAVKAVVSSLARENQIIYSVRAFSKKLWSGKFSFPIPNPTVTDSYGYSRQTVGQSITHKGTDFRAEEGTKVNAMNRGIVRLARTFKIYGKTVIVDHGLGLFTVYMHLSKIKVNEGELVKQGQLVGYSGQTGYADNPHLHISVWVGRISIDPMKFMALFQ